MLTRNAKISLKSINRYDSNKKTVRSRDISVHLLSSIIFRALLVSIAACVDAGWRADVGRHQPISFYFLAIPVHSPVPSSIRILQHPAPL